MAEVVGGITYEVDMDTAALAKGADRVNAALDDVNRKAAETDKSMEDLADSMEELAEATVEEAAALRKLMGQIDPTIAATQRLDKMTEELGQAYDKNIISTNAYKAALAKLSAQYEVLDDHSRGYTKRVYDEAEAFKQATAENKKYDEAQKKSTISAEGFGASLKPLAAAVAGVITIQTLKAWGEMAEQFTLLQSRIQRLSPSVDAARQTYQALLTTAAATGQQLPETVKLWETLTSSLKSLGATNDQVLTLTSTLQKIGKIGGSSAEETANALRQLGQSLASGTLRAEEFNSIAEQTPELIRQLAAGAGMSMGEFRQAMLDGKISSQMLFDLLLQRSADVDTEFKKLPRSASDAANGVAVAFGAALSKLDETLGASQALSKALDGLAGGIRRVSNTQGLDEVNKDLKEAEETLARYTDAKGNVSPMFTADAAALEQQIGQLKIRQKLLTPSPTTTAAPAAAPKATTSPEGQKAVKDLQDQAAALALQGAERAKLLAVQKLGANATAEEKKQAEELAVRIYNLQEAEKARTKASSEGVSTRKKAEKELQDQVVKAAAEEQKGIADNVKSIGTLSEQLNQTALNARELAQRQAELSLNKYATPEQIAQVRDLAAAIYDMRNTQALSKQVGQDVPLVGANQTYEDDLKRYQDYRNAQLITDQQYMELKTQAETTYHAKVLALQEQTFANASLGNELLIGSINALGTSATQSIASILSGTGNLKDALGGIANTVLNAVIGSFVQMGVDWVKQQVMMAAAAQTTTATQVAGTAAVTAAQTAGTATIAATTTTAAATTGTAVAASMAPAAALSSVASFGGAAVIGGAALLATLALAKSFGGGRQYGGPVDGSKMYRVNETGAPEIFNAANGKQYMMPNTRGDVVSNKDATAGGGSGVQVNVNNNNGSNVRVSQSQGMNRQQVIDVVVEDIIKGGRASKAVNATTGTRRAPSR